MFHRPLNTPLCNVKKNRLYHYFSLVIFWKFQKIPEQLLLKAIKNLDGMENGSLDLSLSFFFLNP